MHKTFLAFAFLSVFQIASASDIFNQRPSIAGGGVSNAPQTQRQAAAAGQDNCAALVQERKAIEYIDQKQIWVPIEQQNANYHRMRVLKSEMNARGCSY